MIYFDKVNNENYSSIISNKNSPSCIDMARNFYIIPSSNKRNNNAYTIIQTNISLHDSTLCLYGTADRYVIKSIYIYGMINDNFKIDKFYKNKLYLEYAISSGFSYYMGDNNKNWFENLGVSAMDLFPDYILGEINSSVNFNDVELEFEIPIIIPNIYFTDDEDTRLHPCQQIEFSAEELIDNNTLINMVSNFDMNLFTKTYPINGDINDYNSKCFYLENIIISLFPKLMETLLLQMEIIYDTDLGINIRNVLLPMKGSAKNKYVTDISCVFEELCKLCKNIEESYGSIRLIFFMNEYRFDINVIFKNESTNNTILLQFTKLDIIERFFFIFGSEYKLNFMNQIYTDDWRMYHEKY